MAGSGRRIGARSVFGAGTLASSASPDPKPRLVRGSLAGALACVALLGLATLSAQTAPALARRAAEAQPTVLACSVSLPSTNITTLRRGLATIRLKGRGNGTCTGRLTLTVKVRGKDRRSTTRTIAVASFSIPTGKTTFVKLKLNLSGRSLLLAHHDQLDASLQILKLSPADA
jgi:hypothetical protein